MNFRIVWCTVGTVLLIEAGLMLLPLITALVYHESPVPFRAYVSDLRQRKVL